MGKALISFYLACTSTASAYGAAGSLVVFLVWVYFSAQIVFFGAELVQAGRTRADMNIRYDEWVPRSAGLAGIVTAYWRVFGDGTKVPSSAVLPDGHVELVFNLGDEVGLAGPAFTGLQPDRVVVGPLSKALRLNYRGLVDTLGIRFHPARGAAFLGAFAWELAERLLPLSEVCARLDHTLARLLIDRPNVETEACRAALDQALVNQLPFGLRSDTAVIAAVDRLTGSDVLPLVKDLAAEAHISARQLQRRFCAAVGMTPKRFVRVVRFARAWQMASIRPQGTWAALAAEHGFADQAHLVREFRAFGAEPPTHIFTPDWYEATEISRASDQAQDVRSVQDSLVDRKI
jgi:AraC-like DNA-binding protein